MLTNTFKSFKAIFFIQIEKNRVWVQGSTRETQTALKPELDCAFALAEWNFTNN